MREKITQNLKTNKELQGTIIVTVGTLIGSFFSYLLQFFLGRMLSVEDYGTFNALLSLSYLIWVPSQVLRTSLIKSVSELLAKEDYRRLTVLFWRIVGFASIVGVLVFVGLYLLKGFISSYLNISDPVVVAYFAIFIGVSFVNIAPGSYLQGLLRYKAYSFYIANNNMLRWLIPSALVYFGYQLYGVFVGTALALFLSFFVGVSLLKKNFEGGEEISVMPEVKKIMYFSLPVMFVNFGLMLLNNLDVLLVKRFFEPETAGYYAGTVTLGKILLFGAGTVTIVMFPKVSALYTKGENFLKQFKTLYFLQILMVLGGVLVFSIFPKFLTTAFFGERFLNSVEYLPRFVIFIGIYVLVNFMVMFFLATERTKVFLFLIPVVIMQYILINLYHDSLYSVINVNIFSAAVLLVSLIAYFFTSKKELAYK
jgi:O-antigen/teichoic acid export membrane protein